MGSNKSGKHLMISGVLEFIWAELKTMNRVKLRGMYKIAHGYIRIRYFAPKRIAPKKDGRDIETTYRRTY